ncbi:SHOCT domain-containing protein [Jatrophihabitans sp. GAS493]|uniref:SHOCT domain-containing protein n=1 Tax=Jatrophihabitans sp. GAS493 TaxID=1907575 RepID=UPI000BB96AA6|nr:SHOCT domain-containing protein [Jatrophihabitans sp. GAS493]
MGRPGLVGTMARTAVVAGTATAVAGGVQRHQQNKAMAAQDEQQAEYDTQQAATQSQSEIADLQRQVAEMKAAQTPAAAPVAAPAAGGQGDVISQLEKLASLKQAGILDDAEFASAKAKLLG